MKKYDLIVVGSGIVGLGVAYSAQKRGLSVAVLERNKACFGASVRNFGFVTVSGLQRGQHWQRAMKTRETWLEIAPQAGIEVLQQGLCLPMQRPEARAVGEAFLNTEMGEGCRWLDQAEISAQIPGLTNKHHGVLYSPHEIRVESKTAIGLLSTWLEQEKGVSFHYGCAVTAIDLPTVNTARGTFSAEKVVVCPGHDLYSLYPEAIKPANVRLRNLQMLRVMPKKPIKLPNVIMSDLSLARYDGFADLPEAKALQAKLDIVQPAHRQHGIHLIVVQSADGSLVVGDSHTLEDVENPFRCEAIDDLILEELHNVLPIEVEVIERWSGTYTKGNDSVFNHQPVPNVVIGIASSGKGASTGFAFGEELVGKVLATEQQ